MDKHVYVGFNVNQIESLIDFLEIDLLDSVRRDEYFDNVDYFVNLSIALDKMRKAYKYFKDEQNMINTSEDNNEDRSKS